VLAQKAGVRATLPRFPEQERDGLDFTRYKAPAFVNLDSTSRLRRTCCARHGPGARGRSEFEVPMPLASMTAICPIR